MSLANANAEIYQLLKDGVKVSFKNDEGKDQTETVKVIDWNHPENNNFFLASQFWVTGEIYTRRTDLLGFVNGLPLVFIELKAGGIKEEDTPVKVKTALVAQLREAIAETTTFCTQKTTREQRQKN